MSVALDAFARRAQEGDASFDPPEDFSAQVRELLASTNVLSGRSDA